MLEFAEWLGRNHFIMINETGTNTCWWASESFNFEEFTTEEVFAIYAKEVF